MKSLQSNTFLRNFGTTRLIVIFPTTTNLRDDE